MNAKVSTTTLVAEAPAHLKKHSNLGNELVGEQEELDLIPRVKLLSNSTNNPVDETHEDYLEHAKEGMFWYKSSTENFVVKELYVIPVSFVSIWGVTAQPYGSVPPLGYFISQSDADASIASAEALPNGAMWTNKEVHRHIVIVKNPETGALYPPAVFDLGRSRLYHSKAWNRMIDADGGDRFAGLWKLQLIRDEFNNNKYWNLGNNEKGTQITKQGWVTDEDYNSCKEIFKQSTTQDALQLNVKDTPINHTLLTAN